MHVSELYRERVAYAPCVSLMFTIRARNPLGEGMYGGEGVDTQHPGYEERLAICSRPGLPGWIGYFFIGESSH